MECEDLDAAYAATVLLKLPVAIPAWQYLMAFLLFILIFLYNFLEFHLIGDILRGLRGDEVLLSFNPASEIYHGVASKCRSLHGRYLVTPWLSSPHFQTVFLHFFGNPPAFAYRRQIFRTPDGGTLALDWLLGSDVSGSSPDTNKSISKDDTTPIVVTVPGLTSDSAAPYMKHLVHKIAERGWNAVVMNHRGLGGVPLTSDLFYSAGWTGDVREVINHLHREYPRAPLFAVGTSLGANILVKYLGEEGEGTPLAGAASVCSPWDLLVCDRYINRTALQRFYDRSLAVGLKSYAQLHQPTFSRFANWEGIKKSQSVRDFHHHASCPAFNFETVDAYYLGCSSASSVGSVALPLLCVTALDDPVCAKEAIPWDECRANKNIILAAAAHGGHLACFEGITASRLWWVRAVDEFLAVLHSSPYMHTQNKTHAVGLRSSSDSAVDEAPYVNTTTDGKERIIAVTVAKTGTIMENHMDDHGGPNRGAAVATGRAED